MPVKLAPTLLAFCVCWQVIRFAHDAASEYFDQSGEQEWLIVGGSVLFILFCGAPLYMFVGMGLIRHVLQTGKLCASGCLVSPSRDDKIPEIPGIVENLFQQGSSISYYKMHSSSM